MGIIKKIFARKYDPKKDTGTIYKTAGEVAEETGGYVPTTDTSIPETYRGTAQEQQETKTNVPTPSSGGSSNKGGSNRGSSSLNSSNILNEVSNTAIIPLNNKGSSTISSQLQNENKDQFGRTPEYYSQFKREQEERKVKENQTKYYQDLYDKKKISYKEANIGLQNALNVYSEDKYNRELKEQGIKEIYKESRPNYYDPFSQSLINQSIAPSIAEEKEYLRADVIGETTTGGFIVESSTGLLTPRQLTIKNLNEKITGKTSELPTQLVLGGEQQKGNKDILMPSSYQVASRQEPYKKQSLEYDVYGNVLYSGSVRSVEPSNKETELFFKGTGYTLGAVNPLLGAGLLGVANIYKQKALKTEYGKSSISGKQTLKAFGLGAGTGLLYGAGASLLFRGASKGLVYGAEKIAGKKGLSIAEQISQKGGNILMSSFGGELIGRGYTTTQQLRYGDIGGASITGAKIGGELLGFGAVSYGQRRLTRYSELRNYASKLEPEKKIEFYKAYKEAKSLRGIKPEVRELDLSRLSLIEKNPQAQEFLKGYFSKNNKLIVGGSISQQPQFEPDIIGTKRPGDIDVYVRRLFRGSEAETSLGEKKAKDIASQLRNLGLEAKSKKGKVSINKEKFIEFHSYKDFLKGNVEQVTPIYYPAWASLRKTPEGTNILGLDIQAPRKVIGYYLEPIISGNPQKVRLKDLPAYEKIKESLLKTRQRRDMLGIDLPATDFISGSKSELVSNKINLINKVKETKLKIKRPKEDYSGYKRFRNLPYTPYKPNKNIFNLPYRPLTTKPIIPYTPYKPNKPVKNFRINKPKKPDRNYTPYINPPKLITTRITLTDYTPNKKEQKRKGLLLRRKIPQKKSKSPFFSSPQQRYSPSFTASALRITATSKELKQLQKSGTLGGFSLRPVIID